MKGWWTPRRLVFFVLGWLALGLAGFNASTVSVDRRVDYFIGGSIWAVLFFAVALWPRRKAKRRRGDSQDGRPQPSESGHASGDGEAGQL